MALAALVQVSSQLLALQGRDGASLSRLWDLTVLYLTSNCIPNTVQDVLMVSRAPSPAQTLPLDCRTLGASVDRRVAALHSLVSPPGEDPALQPAWARAMCMSTASSGGSVYLDPDDGPQEKEPAAITATGYQTLELGDSVALESLDLASLDLECTRLVASLSDRYLALGFNPSVHPRIKSTRYSVLELIGKSGTDGIRQFEVRTLCGATPVEMYNWLRFMNEHWLISKCRLKIDTDGAVTAVKVEEGIDDEEDDSDDEEEDSDEEDSDDNDSDDDDDDDDDDSGSGSSSKNTSKRGKPKSRKRTSNAGDATHLWLRRFSPLFDQDLRSRATLSTPMCQQSDMNLIVDHYYTTVLMPLACRWLARSPEMTRTRAHFRSWFNTSAPFGEGVDRSRLSSQRLVTRMQQAGILRTMGSSPYRYRLLLEAPGVADMIREIDTQLAAFDAGELVPPTTLEEMHRHEHDNTTVLQTPLFERSQLATMYRLIEDSGEVGLSGQEISEILNLKPRHASKKLARLAKLLGGTIVTKSRVVDGHNCAVYVTRANAEGGAKSASVSITVEQPSLMGNRADKSGGASSAAAAAAQAAASAVASVNQPLSTPPVNVVPMSNVVERSSTFNEMVELLWRMVESEKAISLRWARKLFSNAVSPNVMSSDARPTGFNIDGSMETSYLRKLVMKLYKNRRVLIVHASESVPDTSFPSIKLSSINSSTTVLALASLDWTTPEAQNMLTEAHGVSRFELEHGPALLAGLSGFIHPHANAHALRLMHLYLVDTYGIDEPIHVQHVLDNLPLGLFLQVIGAPQHPVPADTRQLYRELDNLIAGHTRPLPKHGGPSGDEDNEPWHSVEIKRLPFELKQLLVTKFATDILEGDVLDSMAQHGFLKKHVAAARGVPEYRLRSSSKPLARRIATHATRYVPPHPDDEVPDFKTLVQTARQLDLEDGADVSEAWDLLDSAGLCKAAPVVTQRRLRRTVWKRVRELIPELNNLSSPDFDTYAVWRKLCLASRDLEQFKTLLGGESRIGSLKVVLLIAIRRLPFTAKFIAEERMAGQSGDQPGLGRRRRRRKGKSKNKNKGKENDKDEAAGKGKRRRSSRRKRSSVVRSEEGEPRRRAQRRRTKGPLPASQYAPLTPALGDDARAANEDRSPEATAALEQAARRPRPFWDALQVFERLKLRSVEPRGGHVRDIHRDFVVHTYARYVLTYFLRPAIARREYEEAVEAGLPATPPPELQPVLFGDYAASVNVTSRWDADRFTGMLRRLSSRPSWSRHLGTALIMLQPDLVQQLSRYPLLLSAFHKIHAATRPTPIPDTVREKLITRLARIFHPHDLEYVKNAMVHASLIFHSSSASEWATTDSLARLHGESVFPEHVFGPADELRAAYLTSGDVNGLVGLPLRAPPDGQDPSDGWESERRRRHVDLWTADGSQGGGYGQTTVDLKANLAPASVAALVSLATQGKIELSSRVVIDMPPGQQAHEEPEEEDEDEEEDDDEVNDDDDDDSSNNSKKRKRRSSGRGPQSKRRQQDALDMLGKSTSTRTSVHGLHHPLEIDPVYLEHPMNNDTKELWKHYVSDSASSSSARAPAARDHSALPVLSPALGGVPAAAHDPQLMPGLSPHIGPSSSAPGAGSSSSASSSSAWTMPELSLGGSVGPPPPLARASTGGSSSSDSGAPAGVTPSPSLGPLRPHASGMGASLGLAPLTLGRQLTLPLEDPGARSGPIDIRSQSVRPSGVRQWNREEDPYSMQVVEALDGEDALHLPDEVDLVAHVLDIVRATKEQGITTAGIRARLSDEWHEHLTPLLMRNTLLHLCRMEFLCEVTGHPAPRYVASEHAAAWLIEAPPRASGGGSSSAAAAAAAAAAGKAATSVARFWSNLQGDPDPNVVHDLTRGIRTAVALNPGIPFHRLESMFPGVPRPDLQQLLELLSFDGHITRRVVPSAPAGLFRKPTRVVCFFPSWSCV